MTIILSGTGRTVTVGNLIRRALRLIRVIGEGETPSAQEYSDSVEALNAMLDSWRNDRLTIYAIKAHDFTLTGAASYSIGPAQTFDTVTPVKVDGARYTTGGTEYSVVVIDQPQWAAITDKDLAGSLPSVVYFERGSPYGRVYLNPVPSSGTLTLDLRQPFDNYSNVADEVRLPAGYEQAIAFNLAVMLAPEFGKEATATVFKIADDSLRALKRINSPRPVACMEIGHLGARAYYDITRGE